VAAGARGLRAHGPLRLVHDADGRLVVETGSGTFTTAAAGSAVLTALARHGGRLDTATLVADLAAAPGGGVPLPDLARGIADLVQDGVLVRTPAGPRRRRVRLAAVGDVDPGPCRAALAAGDLHEVTDDADLVVVLCRDHGDPELDTELRRCDDAGTPALLVRLGTARCSIGPLLSGDRRRPAAAPPVGRPVTGGRPDPGGTVHVAQVAAPGGSCPDCLLAALRRNDPRPPTGRGSVVPAGSGAVLAQAAAGLVAAAVDGLLETLGDPPPDPPADGTTGGPGWAEVREVDLRSLLTTVHPVPPCRHAPPPSGTGPAAGEAPATDARDDDGDDEGDDEGAAGFLRRTAALVSPVTGALAPVQVRRVGGGHVLASTTHPVRWRSRPGAPARWVRATATAVGLHEARARAAATGEALERGSASWHGDEERVRCAAADLRARPGARVLLPQELGHHSAAQVAAGEGPPPLPLDLVTDFSPLRRLTGGRAGTPDGPAWIASGAAYFGHPDDEASVFTRPDSNGCAVGSTTAAATLAGLLELLERDAVALWWWPRAARPGLDPALLGDGRATLEGELGRRGRDLWLLDVTTDLGVPVVVAVGARRDGTGLLFGFGAHLDHARAARRAGRELLQVVVCVEDGAPDRAPDRGSDEGGVFTGSAGWDGVHVRDVPFVLAHGRRPAPPAGAAATGVRADLDALLDLLGRSGLETFVLDLTRAAAGVPAVRVVAPALRPWYRRLGPGRLVLPTGPNPWDLPV